MSQRRTEEEEKSAGPPRSADPAPFQHPADHQWSIQMIFEIQKSMAKLEGRFDERTDSIKEALSALRGDVAGLRDDTKGLATKGDVKWAIGIVLTVLSLLAGAVFGIPRLLESRSAAVTSAPHVSAPQPANPTPPSEK